MSDTVTAGISVQNRFDVLAIDNSDVSMNGNNVTPSITRNDFQNSTLDNKLLYMFDELRFIRNEQVTSSLAVNSFQRQLQSYNEKLNEVIHVTNIQTDFMKAMAYKSIDSEARDRRDNLLFRGFVENYGENCVEIIRDFLHHRLAIDSSHMYIARAHRTGKRIPYKTHQNRPIIAKFRDFGDIELIMTKVRMLKGTPFSVDYDYPTEIRDARSKLWPRLKELRRDNPRARVLIVYPAKLIMDGNVVEDALPDWNENVRTNRLSICDKLQYVKPIRVGRMAADAPITPSTPISDMLLSQVDDVSQVAQSASSQVQVPTNVSQSPISMQMETQPSPATDTRPMPLTPQGCGTDRQNSLDVRSKSITRVSEEVRSDVVVNTQSHSSIDSNGSECLVINASVDGDETSVKSVNADATNPFIQPETKVDSGPVRGRSRASRSEKSQKRSETAIPYRRKSVSNSRERKNVLPAPKRSSNCPPMTPTDVTVNSTGISDTSSAGNQTSGTSDAC